jgi:hypothetical protein
MTTNEPATVPANDGTGTTGGGVTARLAAGRHDLAPGARPREEVA